MKKYELLVILPGTLDEKEAEKRIQEIVTLTKEQTENAELSTLGKNRLAYPVKQIRYGYFYVIIFTTDNEKLKNLQNKLSLLRDVLRAEISIFNTELSSHQKIAYSTGNLGVAMMTVDKDKEEGDGKTFYTPRTQSTPSQPVAAPKEEKKVDMDEIKKKLDQILEETDIIPGV